MKSTLIKDTTKEEREQLVKESLSFSDIGCEDAVDGFDFYLPYIEGKMELRDLNMSYKTSFVVENPEPEKGSSCMR